MSRGEIVIGFVDPACDPFLDLGLCDPFLDLDLYLYRQIDHGCGGEVIEHLT